MWFTIPTPPHIVNGVERGSSVNRKFALRSDEEARAFLKFETDDGVNLRENYMAIMTAVLEQLQAGRSPTSLLLVCRCLLRLCITCGMSLLIWRSLG